MLHAAVSSGGSVASKAGHGAMPSHPKMDLFRFHRCTFLESRRLSSMADDSDDDLFAEEDTRGAAELFGVLHLLEESGAHDEPLTSHSLAALLAAEPHSLHLSKRSLSDVGLKLLGSTLAAGRPCSLTELTLDNNIIGDAGAVALADACPMLQQLERLDLSSNAIGSTGFDCLARTLPPTLTACDLSSNGLGDAGVAALGRAIADGRLVQLRCLYLDRNDVGDAGLTSLGRDASAAAGGALPRLSELWLSNNHIGDAGASALFESLAAGAFAALGDLRLQYNSLGDASMATLSASLGRGALARAWYLGLCDNGFTDAGLVALSESISAGGLPRLEFVTISGSGTSSAAQQAVQDALTRRPR